MQYMHLKGYIHIAIICIHCQLMYWLNKFDLHWLYSSCSCVCCNFQAHQANWSYTQPMLVFVPRLQPTKGMFAKENLSHRYWRSKGSPGMVIAPTEWGAKHSWTGSNNAELRMIIELKAGTRGWIMGRSGGMPSRLPRYTLRDPESWKI